MSGDGGLAPSGASTPIGGLSLRQPVHVAPQASLQSAASTMRREGISSLVVDTHPPSFMTERDLVRAIADGRALSAPVSEIATRGPVWVPPSVTVGHAAAVMVGLGFRHLVVMGSSGEVVGVLSMRDAFEVLLDTFDPQGWLPIFRAGLGDFG